MNLLYFFIFLFVLWQTGLAHPCYDQKMNTYEPLFLTPFIQNGEIEKAKGLSWVEPFPRFDYTSYSGFITIDDEHDSNMFFWYFLAKNDPEKAPVLLWMTGGPGISSLYALFGETGPFYPDPNLNLRSREFNWVSDFNVVYVDIPVGAGFSYTNSTTGYAKNTPQMASQVAKFLDQFCTLFVEFMDNDFYIVGKSYSGKVAMALAAELLDRAGQPLMNLVGVVTVCGFLQPVNTVVNIADHYYHLGMIDEKQRKDVADQETIMVDSYLNNSMHQARQAYSKLSKALVNMTGLIEKSNFVFSVLPKVFEDYERFVDQRQVREKIHVGDRHFNGPNDVTGFVEDYLVGSKVHVEYVLGKSGTKVLLLTGQLDLYVTPPAHRNFVTNLSWPGSASFNVAKRFSHKVDRKDDEVAGYVQQTGQLTDVMLRSAGHMISYDQPRATLDILSRFIHNQTFNYCE